MRTAMWHDFPLINFRRFATGVFRALFIMGGKQLARFVTASKNWTVDLSWCYSDDGRSAVVKLVWKEGGGGTGQVSSRYIDLCLARTSIFFMLGFFYEYFNPPPPLFHLLVREGGGRARTSSGEGAVFCTRDENPLRDTQRKGLTEWTVSWNSDRRKTVAFAWVSYD